MRKIAILGLLLVASLAVAAPPQQESVTPVLGPKLFRDGDVIEITDVTATSPRLEQGDTITVKGRARLQSRESATLSLYLTQTKGDGREETDKQQSVAVSKGLQDFELKITVKHQGVLHLTYYDLKSGQAIGGVYFGTSQQMKEIATWDLKYYLDR